MSQTNTAAWIDANDTPLSVRSSPSRAPNAGELLIRNHAVAINPIDYKLQTNNIFNIPYPFILGWDIAGTVVEVGAGVVGFAKGTRVLAHPAGGMSNDNTQSGFQEYVIGLAVLAAPIPESMTFEEAAVLPLGICTAAAGLYQEEFLALDLPSVQTPPGSKGEVVVVWGGSSSVGSCAIQLLRNSGYDVYATASKRNATFVEGLGASFFDYTEENVVQKILAALEGKKLVGAYDAIGSPDTVAALCKIAEQSQGKKMVASTNPTAGALEGSDVVVKGVFATTIAKNAVGSHIFGDFLPKALAGGKFLAKPDPIVIGKGLDKIQAGMDKLKAGVSAGKVVVSI